MEMGDIPPSLLWLGRGFLPAPSGRREKREGARQHIPLDSINLPKPEGKKGRTITGEIHAGAIPRFAHLASTLNEPRLLLISQARRVSARGTHEERRRHMVVPRQTPNFVFSPRELAL